MAKKEEIASASGRQTISCDLPRVVKENDKPSKLIIIKGRLNQDSDIHWFVVDEAGQTIACTNPHTLQLRCRFGFEG